MNSILTIKRGPTTLIIEYKDLDNAARYHTKRLLDDFCYKKLTTFQYIRSVRRYVVDKNYYVHDSEKGVFTLPAPFFDQLIDHFVLNGIDYRVTDDKHSYNIREISYNIKEGWVPKEWQVEPIKYLSGKHVRCGLEMQTGKGKAQPLDAKIKVPGGWSTMGDMQVGTKISAPDGTTTHVTAIHPQGEKTIYKVSFADGRSTECCGDHLWKVYKTQWPSKSKVITTKELIKLMGKAKYSRYSVDLIKSEEGDDVNLPMSPYTLGALLGNGHIGKYNIKISSANQELLDSVSEALPDNLMLLHIKDYDYSISKSTNDEPMVQKNGYIKIMEDLGLSDTRSNNKFVPEMYKHSSTEQRFEILRGLLDTDGTVCANQGSISFTSVSAQLANDVQYIVRSLGGLASISTRVPKYIYKGVKKNGQLAYTVRIRFKQPKNLFSLNRKLERVKETNQYTDGLKLRIVKVEEVGDKEAQCISVAHKDKLYITDNFIVTHNTFCTINALSNMKMASIIVVRGLVSQWKEAFNEQTDIGDKAYCIQGFKSIDKLFKMKEKPDVFICSIDTMRAWQRRKKKYKTVPSYAEFIEMFGIGVKTVDEAHLCFHTSTILDLTVSIPHNIYLTATFDTADSMVKKIFRTIFSSQMKYGGMEYDKYADSYCYSYAGNVPEKVCMTPQGYSHAKYEEYMLKHPHILIDYLERLIIPIVNMHYINKKYNKKKLVIFCARVDMVEAVQKHIKYVYPHLNVLTYVHKDPDSNLEEGDIIVSTHKSCGTGTDIANLAAVSNMVSFQASTLAKQVFGRLRKPKDGSTPEYIDVLDLRIKAHIRHWRERGPIIKDCALTHKEFRL